MAHSDAKLLMYRWSRNSHRNKKTFDTVNNPVKIHIRIAKTPTAESTLIVLHRHSPIKGMPTRISISWTAHDYPPIHLTWIRCTGFPERIRKELHPPQLPPLPLLDATMVFVKCMCFTPVRPETDISIRLRVLRFPNTSDNLLKV